MATSNAPLRELGYQSETASKWWGSLDEEQTPELRWPLSIGVYDRMRTDSQVQSVLRAVTLPILQAQWSIDGSGCDPKVAQHVADDLGLPIKGQPPVRRLRTKGRFQWGEHLRLALLEQTFGHSVFEQVYRLDGNLARLHKLAWRPPSTITAWNVARDGGLVSIEQSPLGAGRIVLPVDRLVVYVHDREGANWAGRSLLRSAYRYDLLKARMLRVQSQTVDRNGMGVPIYVSSPVPEQVTDPAAVKSWVGDELEAGLGIATEMRAGENSGAAIPNGAKLRLAGVEGALPDAEKPIRYYDEQIARSALLHFLNLGGDGATGSYNLSDTFAAMFYGALGASADHVADVVNAHVIEDLVDLNYGESEPAPVLVHEEIGDRSPATAEAIKALIDCGALTAGVGLEQHLRQRFGLPQLEGAS